MSDLINKTGYARAVLGQLRFLGLLTLFIGAGPLIAIVAIEFVAVMLGAGDDALGDYFVALYLLFMAGGAYLFVRYFDRG